MGTDLWMNWLAFEPEREAIQDSDIELHSDRQVSGGQAEFGPYSLTPVMRAGVLDNEVGEAVILHEALYAWLMPEVIVDGELAKSDSSAYHGGTMADEIAALVSLELGVRLRLAGTRETSGIRYPDRDPSPPIYFEVPQLIHPGSRGREFLPHVMTRPASLAGLELLPSFPHLQEKDQIELARAARSYASAIWWANEDPNQAWLQLVSAVEVAASRRQRKSTPAQDLLREHWPELWELIVALDDAPRAAVSKMLAQQTKATAKCCDFLAECAPEPPALRPEFAEFDWNHMREHAKIIYAHRSRALHSAKPFPAPMLERPRVESSGAVQEAPFGLNSGALGGIWDAAQTPMLLSTFEYVTRGALLHWWGELAATVRDTGERLSGR
jgi:hypothetical protein